MMFVEIEVVETDSMVTEGCCDRGCMLVIQFLAAQFLLIAFPQTELGSQFV